jgi:hypothetical protein
MGGKVLQPERRAASLQIGRRRTDHLALPRQHARGKPPPGARRVVADHQIIAVMDDIHHMIAVSQIKLQPGVGNGQIEQDRLDAMAPEEHRHRDPDLADNITPP